MGVRARLGPPAGLGARIPRRGPQCRAHGRDSRVVHRRQRAARSRARHELRWAIVQALSARGAISDAEIEAELERDPSAAGQRHAVTARALAPTAEAKAEAWRLAVEDDTLPNAIQEAVIVGFSRTVRDELLAPYVARYFAEVPDVWDRRTSELAQNVVVGLFPTWASTIDADTLRAADEFLGPPTCRRRCAGWSARDARTSCGRLRPARPTCAAGRADS